MAEFLNTSGISYYLEELIKNSKDSLTLVSPYLQFNERIKEHLQNLNIQKLDIRIVCRENKLNTGDSNWLASQSRIKISLCKTLHAKCYINDNEAIITSMNLYEFSQVNNNEMGIYFTKEQDPDLFLSTWKEVQRLLAISEEFKVTGQTVSGKQEKMEPKSKDYSRHGFCIRTGVAIPFNVEKPLSYEAFKKWDEYGDVDYPEKFCHFSGEKSSGENSVRHPVLKKNWKKAMDEFGFWSS